MTLPGPMRTLPALMPVLALVLPLLTACALPGTRPPPQLFTVTPGRSAAPQVRKVNWQLLVDASGAPAGIDTSRIALRDRPTVVDYYADVAWTDRAPLMFQSALVGTFEDSGKIAGVGREGIGLRADYVLKTDLREFQAEYDKPDRTAPPNIRVRLTLKLIELPRRIVIASDDVEAVVRARSAAFTDIISAYNEASTITMTKTVEWTLQHGNGEPPPEGGAALRFRGKGAQAESRPPAD